MPQLFHVSSDAAVLRLEPQPSPSADFGLSEPVVLAVSTDRLPHYLLPGPCPRIILRATPTTSQADRQRYFPDGQFQVIAIGMDWYERVRSAKLFIYELEAVGFTPVKGIEGYFMSRHAISLRKPRVIENAVEAIVGCGYKLRCLPNLESLRSEIVGSTVQYSLISMPRA